MTKRSLQNLLTEIRACNECLLPRVSVIGRQTSPPRVCSALARAPPRRTAREPARSPRDPSATRRISRLRSANVANVPVMTRLHIEDRAILDTLIDAGVARSRSEALAWTVRLVAENESDWLNELREAMTSSSQAGPNESSLVRRQQVASTHTK